MSELATTCSWVGELGTLFATPDVRPIEKLVESHGVDSKRISDLFDLLSGDHTIAMLGYMGATLAYSDDFDKARDLAGRKLAAHYWREALATTDVLDAMPAERQRQWYQMLHDHEVPPFTMENVRATIADHLANRHKYFAERVAGVFRALSPDHKTNLATGFGGRLIIANAVEHHWNSRGDALRDLRIVVAKFVGLDIGRDYDIDQHTRKLLRTAWEHTRGVWIPTDGGALEIRVYGKGTCHIRLHDEIRYRLNNVLASEYPGAIPESERTRPAYTRAKKSKTKVKPKLFVRPLAVPVLAVLAKILDYTARDGRHCLPQWTVAHGYGWRDIDKHLRRQVRDVMVALGGTPVSPKAQKVSGSFSFPYPPTEVLRSVMLSGALPDDKSHQYYPTPPELARRVVELANIGPEDRVLEPSAGTGALARLLPKDTTTCVEVNTLHAKILRAHGFRVITEDFLTYEVDAKTRPSVVVMNPPFDRGQARDHVEHAAGLLLPQGRLVAVLPSGMVGKLDLQGWHIQWDPPVGFPGTSIDVVVLHAVKP